MDFPHTVTRLRAPLVAGRYGDQVRDWANAAATTGLAAHLQPDTTREEVAGEQRVETTWRAWFPASADWARTDRLEWDGLPAGERTLEVVGDVVRWARGAVPGGRPGEQVGRTDHLAATLRRVTGG